MVLRFILHLHTAQTLHRKKKKQNMHAQNREWQSCCHLHTHPYLITSNTPSNKTCNRLAWADNSALFSWNRILLQCLLPWKTKYTCIFIQKWNAFNLKYTCCRHRQNSATTRHMLTHALSRVKSNLLQGSFVYKKVLKKAHSERRAVCFSDWKSTRVLIKKPLPISHPALCPTPATWWRWILRRTSGWSPLWRSGRSETSSTTFPWGNKLVWALVTAVCFSFTFHLSGSVGDMSDSPTLPARGKDKVDLRKERFSFLRPYCCNMQRSMSAKILG